MGKEVIGSYPSTAILPVTADTGGHASGEDFGAQVGARLEQLGSRLSQASATAADIAEMHSHIEAQQWVSKTMADHRVEVDKYMSDPNNYSDPKFAENVQKLQADSLPKLEKDAPSALARNALRNEYNQFTASRTSAAYKTQSDVMMQKGFNDYANMPDTMLDNYRTNLKNPNVDASADTFQQTDKLLKRIDQTFGVIAPTMARELKDRITTDMVYGTVNTNPDLAEKLLDRGTVEGRTRHTLENTISNAREAQTMGFKQEAADAVKGLLTKAEMFPDQVQRGFPAEYFEAHGYKPKQAAEMATKLQYQLDVNKDFATIRDQITGSDEGTLVKKQNELYNNLKSLDANSDKFNHDAQVLQRVQKFVSESTQVMHEDPVKYLSNYNKEITSATQAYRDDPSPERFNTLAGNILKYQGAAPVGDTSGKYLNLAMHEMHLLDKQQAQDLAQQILGSGPSEAGKILHNTLQQYNPDNQGIVLSDLVNHGKLPIEVYAMERTYGAPFNSKLTGAIMKSKSLHETIGRVAGSRPEDLNKLMDSNNEWLQWSKVTASDNFQRQDVVSGFREAIQTYALGMIQDGKPAAEAVKSAISDLTQWGHTTANVNGRSVQFTTGTYKGDPEMFTEAVKHALGQLDINRIKLTDDSHRPIFPVLSMAGHAETADAALRYQIQHRVVPNINPDGKSFSLYYEDSGNHFQLRDRDNKPFNMQISDLPTYHWNSGSKTWKGNLVEDNLPWPVDLNGTHWPVHGQTQDDRDREGIK